MVEYFTNLLDHRHGYYSLQLKQVQNALSINLLQEQDHRLRLYRHRNSAHSLNYSLLPRLLSRLKSVLDNSEIISHALQSQVLLKLRRLLSSHPLRLPLLALLRRLDFYYCKFSALLSGSLHTQPKLRLHQVDCHIQPMRGRGPKFASSHLPNGLAHYLDLPYYSQSA